MLGQGSVIPTVADFIFVFSLRAGKIIAFNFYSLDRACIAYSPVIALLGMFLVLCDFLAFFVGFTPRPCIVYFHHPVSFYIVHFFM